MARTTFKIEGFRELDATLGELTKPTARNVMRRACIKALEPMAEIARDHAAANNWSGALAGSITVSSRAAGYARRRGRKQNEVEVYMGPGGVGEAAPPQGSLQEFGTAHHPPQPSIRPAWDEGKDDLAPAVASEMSSEIEKAAQRAARKQARLIARNGG